LRIIRPSLLVLIRHAESARNKAKAGHAHYQDDEARQAVRGIPDYKIPLTEEGHRQAKLTGEALIQRFGRPDYLYHSGYKRTQDTAQAILEACTPEDRARIQVRENPFIRERHAGYTYDMTAAEAERYFPFFQEHWETHGQFIAEPPGGESLISVLERVYLFNGTLFRDRVGQKVFVVTHGGTLRCFRYWLEHWSYEDALRWPEGQSPENCGYTVYEPNEEGRLKLAEYNTVCWR
jgi:2,3-bisphosphoglycerate-dependent phosphoglycerate mutase